MVSLSIPWCFKSKETAYLKKLLLVIYLFI